MMRTPMPELFRKLAEQCGCETGGVLRAAADASGRGEAVEIAWREQLCRLPLNRRELAALYELSFCGDEDALCKELSFAAYELAKCAEELERSRPEEEKRTTALCFSGAALVVILLI